MGIKDILESYEKPIFVCLNLELKWDFFAKKTHVSADFLDENFCMFHGEARSFEGQIFVS